MINYRLAEKKGLSEDTIRDIESMHLYRNNLDELRVAGKLDRTEYLKLWTSNEFLLQDAWGFERDINKHMFWASPYCTCPKLDNRDSWGTPYHYYAADCRLHGVNNVQSLA